MKRGHGRYWPSTEKVRWSICLLFYFRGKWLWGSLISLAPAFSTPLKQKPQYFALTWAAESNTFPTALPQRCFSLGYWPILNGVAAVNSRGAATQSQKWQTIFLPRPLTLRLLRASELLCDTWKETLGFPSAVRKTAEANGHVMGKPTETQVQISMLMLKL